MAFKQVSHRCHMNFVNL